jgi:CRISPR-associated protein Cas2
MKSRSTAERVYLLSYDIADDARRERLSRLLESRGQRVQWSVFEVISTEEGISALLAEASESSEIFDADEDSLRCYPLCARCRERVDVRGNGRPLTRPGSPLVL